jgi:hypothetical protein
MIIKGSRLYLRCNMAALRGIGSGVIGSSAAFAFIGIFIGQRLGGRKNI